MYLGEVITSANGMRDKLCLVGRSDAFPESQLLAAAKMEIWHTKCSDPGEDFSEIRLLDVDGNQTGICTVPGY